MIRKTISHYTIIEKLGEGGMGVVYKAEDTKLDRTVALKFLMPQDLGGEEEKARFLHEAKAAAALNHPNICTIHEIDEHEGQSFIAMEYIEGRSLKEEIEAGPLALNKAVNVAVQAAEGLAAAHEKGIVHRDIKSANIMITGKGRTTIMDFGLAKSVGRTQLTREGTTLGTIAYMSPEQARGHEVDHRSDIWSLGVVLYEMITGRRPFRGEYEQAVVYSIVNADPEPLTALRTGVPMELERIATRCLSKDPSERYQTAKDLAADLRRIQRLESTEAWRKRVEEVKARRRGLRGFQAPMGRWLWLLIICVPAIAVLIITVIVPRYFSPVVEQPGQMRKMLAILPFDNLGPAEDEYFANGITDAITARLACIHDLGVISRQSAMQYKKSEKSIKQIGEELGVDYILEGTVQRERPGDPASRVRCIPQLIHVRDDTHVWAATYDRSLSQVFEVQSEIAERVARELDIALFDAEKQALSERPTENLEAYEYYLLGNTYMDRSTASAIDSAVSMFSKAIALDPRYAAAWAKLSQAYGSLYWAFLDTQKFAEAEKAAHEAMRLAPDLPEVSIALGYLDYIRLDFDGAIKHYHAVLAKRPNDTEALQHVGFALRRKGKLEESLQYFEQLERKNPRSYKLLYDNLGITNFLLRRYDEAERYCDRAITLFPDIMIAYFGKAQTVLNRDGDIDAAERILREAARRTTVEVELFGLSISRIQIRLLPDIYRIFLEIPDIAEHANSPTDTVFLYNAQAELSSILEHPDHAHAYYDSARVCAERYLIRFPNSLSTKNLLMGLALAYAGLGMNEEAVRAGEEAVKLCLLSPDVIVGSVLETDLAGIYVRCGEYEKAIDQLDHLLSIPSEISSAVLEIDPLWDPLRDNPRFKQLLEKYSGDAS